MFLFCRDFLHRDSKRFFCLLLLFLISDDHLIFLLWYCCFADKFLRFIQLNCPCHSRKYSVASMLSNFWLITIMWGFYGPSDNFLFSFADILQVHCKCSLIGKHQGSYELFQHTNFFKFFCNSFVKIWFKFWYAW